MTISTQETADNSHLFVGISFFRTLPKKGDFYSYRFYRVLKRLPEPPILLNYMQKYLLVCLMGLSVVGCSGKKDQLSIEWEKENKFADIVSFQIESISKTRQVEPDVIGFFYTYYKQLL
jgi:hypothetical protein